MLKINLGFLAIYKKKRKTFFIYFFRLCLVKKPKLFCNKTNPNKPKVCLPNTSLGQKTLDKKVAKPNKVYVLFFYPTQPSWPKIFGLTINRKQNQSKKKKLNLPKTQKLKKNLNKTDQTQKNKHEEHKAWTRMNLTMWAQIHTKFGQIKNIYLLEIMQRTKI